VQYRMCWRPGSRGFPDRSSPACGASRRPALIARPAIQAGHRARFDLARNVLGMPVPKVEDEPPGSLKKVGRQPLAYRAHARKIYRLRRRHEVLSTALYHADKHTGTR
jgi:hypothetical protein